MESVSCHQKGLVMGNILWSVDKKIYSDKEDHTLAITGWAITRNQSECDFILYGSGKELFVPEPSRCERADVAKDLKETKEKVLAGVRRLSNSTTRLVIVTNEVNADINSYSEETEKYRECIGMVNQSLAELADIVTEVVYGIPVCIRKEQKKYEEYKKNME